MDMGLGKGCLVNMQREGLWVDVGGAGVTVGGIAWPVTEPYGSFCMHLSVITGLQWAYFGDQDT